KGEEAAGEEEGGRREGKGEGEGQDRFEGEEGGQAGAGGEEEDRGEEEAQVVFALRALIQRVLSASVTVDGARISQIGPGLLVFVGVGRGDAERDVEWMVEKVSGLRIFEDEAGKMNRSLLETSKAMIAVSQFTLYGDAQ